jgi:hypothetical protein
MRVKAAIDCKKASGYFIPTTTIITLWVNGVLYMSNEDFSVLEKPFQEFLNNMTDWLIILLFFHSIQWKSWSHWRKMAGNIIICHTIHLSVYRSGIFGDDDWTILKTSLSFSRKVLQKNIKPLKSGNDQYGIACNLAVVQPGIFEGLNEGKLF